MNDTSQVTSCGANGRLGQRARIDALEHGHARVVPDLVVQLPVAHVERDHARRAALQQHVGEPAGGGADVERVEPGDVDPERVEGVRELVPGARDVRRRLAHRERRVLVDLLAGACLLDI